MFVLGVALGLIGCVIFILILIVQSLREKNGTMSLIGLFLCMALLLGSGVLNMITQPDISGTAEQAPVFQRPQVQKPSGSANISDVTANSEPDSSDASLSEPKPGPQDPQPAVTPEQGGSDIPPQSAAAPKDGVYRIGDTWTVEGQWSVTVTGVSETSERNRYSEKNPEAVYIVDYTYTNLGYEKEVLDGLFVSLGDLGSIVDSKGFMAYSYPVITGNSPKRVPVDATCVAQDCIGVDNAGDFKIIYSLYDGNGTKQSATFEITVS